MRDIVLILLSSIPIAIAISFKASDSVLMIAAAPLLLLALVIKLNRAKSLYTPPSARIGIIVIASVLVMTGAAISVVLWSVLISPH